MLQFGPAKKVTIHLNEDTSANQDFLYKEILSFLLSRGVAGACLIRPEAGFGYHHRIHSASLSPEASTHLPLRLEFIESLEMTESIMPDLCALLTDGLIEVQDTVILKSAHKLEQPI